MIRSLVTENELMQHKLFQLDGCREMTLNQNHSTQTTIDRRKFFPAGKNTKQ